MTKRSLLLIVGLAIGLSPGLSAQRPVVGPSLEAGTVLRIRLASGLVEGARLLQPYGPDSTHLRYCRYPAPPCRMGGVRYVARAATDVISMERLAGSGALPGAVIGAGLGLAFGSGLRGLGDGSLGRDVAILGSSALVFSVLGGMVGSTLENWVPLRWGAPPNRR